MMPSEVMIHDIIEIGSGSSSEEVFPHVEEVEELIHIDAETLMHCFRESYVQVQSSLQRPRVLIAGTAGAGKSSIINTVFGSEIAKEGAGRPITQNFQKFEPEGIPIILYDSKGLEVGLSMEEFVKTTRDYFTSCNNGVENNCIENQVDLVWYIVNSAAARFQDFEQEICEKLFSNIPIIFILNKADISTSNQRRSLKKVIRKLHLKNCIGIFDSVTQKYTNTVPTNCESCKSDGLMISRRTNTAICEDCGHKFSTKRSTGLDKIVSSALDALPAFVKDAFVNAQRVSFKLKEVSAKQCIVDFYEEQIRTITAQGLLNIFTSMLAKLSSIWDFKEHAALSASQMAKDVVGSLSIRDKIFLFVHKNKHQRLRATAIGIIWNRCVRELAKIVFLESVENVQCINDGCLEKDWSMIMAETFRTLSIENIDKLESLLKEISVNQLLELDMPTDPYNSPHCGEVTKSSLAFLYEGKKCWAGFLDEPAIRSFSAEDVRRTNRPKQKRKHRRSKSKPYNEHDINSEGKKNRKHKKGHHSRVIEEHNKEKKRPNSLSFAIL